MVTMMAKPIKTFELDYWLMYHWWMSHYAMRFYFDLVLEKLFIKKLFHSRSLDIQCALVKIIQC